MMLEYSLNVSDHYKAHALYFTVMYKLCIWRTGQFIRLKMRIHWLFIAIYSVSRVV